MIFYRRERQEVKSISILDVPVMFLPHIIKDADMHLTKGAFGTVLSQRISGDGFVIWQHHFWIDQPCTLLACNDSSVLTINYMLRGSPYAKLPGRADSLLNGGFYRMFFVPRSAHPVTFKKGMFSCIHLDFNPTELSANLAGRFRLHTLLEYLAVGRDKLFPYLGGRIDNEIKTLLNDLISLSSADKVKQRYLAYKLLLRFVRKHHTFVDDFAVVENYIRHNLSESLTVKELARLCFKSESEFYKQFKARFGTSPIAYLRQIRMEEAMKLLSNTKLPVGVVALHVGFNNQAFFNRSFKNYFGYAPGSFRRDVA